MLLRLSSSASRGAIVILALFLAFTFSYASIRSARATHFADLNTLQGFQRATQIEPGNAHNWYLLGDYLQYNFEEIDVPRAIQAYQKALSLDPRSAETWLDLGAAYEFESNVAAARNGYLQAKRVYPLSAEVAWRYGNFLLRQNELDTAFTEIRHAVEADPKRAAEAFSRCIRVQPDINSVLDRALPPSRDVYLAVISELSSAGQTDQGLTVWSRLTGLRPQLSLSDSFPLVEALIQKKQFIEAQRVWTQAAGFAGVEPSPVEPGSVIWDGGFESGLSGGGFAWRFPFSASGVQIALDAQEKHSGKRSLRLIFNGRQNVYFNDVCQYVLVTPGVTYRFSAWVRTLNLTTDQGLRFGLHSLSDSPVRPVWTDDLRGTQPWTRIEYPWQAAKSVQGLNICVSRLQSAKLNSNIQGTAWVDDVSLVPLSAGSAKP
jgi:hypothetical protein